MKEWKSLICMNLVLCMVLGILNPVAVYAEDAILQETPVEIEEEITQDEAVETPIDPENASITLLTSDTIASGSCGVNLTWVLDEDGTMTISGNGAMYGYSYDNQPWIDYRDSVVKLTVNPGVTTVGKYAFSYCNALTEVSLPNGLTSVAENAFYACDGLLEIVLPGTVESIGRDAFSYCERLKSATLSEGITTLPYDTFSDCSALTTVVLPASLQTIGAWSFKNCISLSSVALPDNLQEIEKETFKGCTSLKTIEFGSTITAIGQSAFQDCTSLTTLEFPDNLRTIDQEAFRGCTSLQNVSIGSGITTIEYAAFGSCTSLTTVTIDNYQTSVAVDADAFPAAATISYKPISDDAVMGTWNIGKSNETDVIATLYATGRMVISGNGAMADFEDGLLADVSDNLGSKNINSIVIQEGVTSIGDYAFWGGSNVTSISFPESLTAIGYGAFNNCYNLTTVDIGSNIRVIERKAFANCDGLTTININTSQYVVDVGTDSFPEETTVAWLPGDDNTVASVWEIGTYDETDVTATLYTSGRLVITGVGSIEKSPWPKTIVKVEIGEGITQIGSNIFSECTALTEVSLPSTLTNINASAFRGCTSLTTISTLENVTSIGNYAFYNCTALTTLSSLANVTNIGGHAFRGCSALTTLSTLENVAYIGIYAFSECSKLSDVDLDSAQNIDSYAFYNSGIKTANLYDIVRIYDYAFSNCPNLTDVEIGPDLEYIGEQAFANCPNLSEVFWEAEDVGGIGKDSDLFLNSGKGGKGITLYAYTETIPAYLFYTSSENAGKEPNLTAIRTSNKKYGSPTEIGAFAFYRAVHLSSVGTLQRVEVIGDGAFNTCSALTSIELGDNLEILGSKAFFRSGLTSLAAGVNLTQIGESAFAECAEGFYLEGYIGSTLEQYAQTNGISFIPFATSGTEGSIQWNFDADSGELTVTGAGAITTIPWSRVIGQVKSLSLGEGITEIAADVFVDCNLSMVVFPSTLTTLSAAAFDVLDEAYFLGAMPVIAEPAGRAELLFDSVYYLSGAAGWNNCTWEKDYDCGTIAPFSNKQGTMTILEDTDYYRKESSVSGNVGVLVPLESYSEDAQIRYYEYASDANLVGWSNGSTVYKPTDSAELIDGSVLTAQWKVKTFTIDGDSYPVNKDASGSGWQYYDNVLTLNGYSGGGITLPDGVWLYAKGINTISGSIVSVENDLGFVTSKALVMQILGGHTTVTNVGITSDNDTLLLDSDFIQIMVEEGATLDLHSCDYIASPADRITLTCDGVANLISDDTCAISGKGKNRVYLLGAGSITVQASEYAIAKGITPQFGYGYDIYLEPDEIDSASKYVAGPYLRREARKWSIQLDANGGIWSDSEDIQKTAQQAEDSSIGLKKYKDLLTRFGYVLIGWSDEDNTIDFAVNDWVPDKYEDITLYAVWQKDALQVDGKIFSVTESASGRGWTFTSAKSNQPATLSIFSDYSGKPIAYTHDLTVNIEGDVEIAGTTGACAIEVLGDLNLNIAEGDVKIVGGNGEHAIHATGDIEFQNDGCTSIEGGNGGHGIYGYNVHFSSNGTLAIVGGLRSSAVCADNTVSLGAVNGVINILAGQNTSYAVSGSGFGYSGKTRFYCGQNAGSLSRKSAFRYAGSYPYARIQPKLVVITLDANGGAIGGSTIATLSLLQTDDNTFTLKNSAQPFRNGYAFNGWNTAADGSGESYTAGQTYTAAEDAEIQLFAQWEAVEPLSGSFNQNEDELTIVIPTVLTNDANVIVACYNNHGQMLDMAFGMKKETKWIFEIGNVQNAYTWTVFFTGNDTHAPKQMDMPVSISK